MTLAELSLKKPVFVTSALLLTLITGLYFMRGVGVSMYPDVNLPFVTVVTRYSGAGPQDVETLVTKPLENSISATAGLKKLTSSSKDGISVINAEFTLETDARFALSQVRDKVAAVRADLPDAVNEPTVSLVNMDDVPIMTLTLTSPAGEAALADLAEYTVVPRLEQVPGVGRVEIQGTRKREIKVELDRRRLAFYELSAIEAAAALARSGNNISAGKKEADGKGRYYRIMGEFASPAETENAIVRFSGNDMPVRIRELGRASESLADAKMLAFRNGRKTVAIAVYKQSRGNTVAAAKAVREAAARLEKELGALPGSPKLEVAQDSAKPVSANVIDVEETIYAAIALTFFVVFLFLRNWRSTIITALAIPNSLLGAVALMYFAGFTFNIMSLLALSLAVGLLVDDAIVVRENIFRRMQAGEPPFAAALNGTNEVRLAVVATSLTVAAVFLPIAFMKGLVGQYFREFGLTICFVLLISTFDSLTIAPMLSAYLSKKTEPVRSRGKAGRVLKATRKLLKTCLKRPLAALVPAAAVFGISIWFAARIPTMFMPPAENGEFYITLEGAPDITVHAMADKALDVDRFLRSNAMVKSTFLTVGTWEGEDNRASVYVELKPLKERGVATTKAQEILRGELKKFAALNPVINDAGRDSRDRPVSIAIKGDNAVELQAFAGAFYDRFKNHPSLTDPDLSEKPGKPETRVIFDPEKARQAGISVPMAGRELRAQLEGEKVSALRRGGREYDVRLRLREDDRDLASNFFNILVPNINGRLIKLDRVARLEQAAAPKSVNRVNRSRCITFSAGLASKGPGLQVFMDEMNAALSSGLKPPAGISIAAEGDAENYGELMTNVLLALLLGVCFIYLTLASLYESFTAPFAILLVLPLAACGALLALYALGLTLDAYSIIGCVLLLGIAAKNSILLVDRMRTHLSAGAGLGRAALKAFTTRLRPILMTSGALVAGMAAVAVGLNETSAQRVSMGWAVIGGVVSSTLMSLFVVPAAYALIFKVRAFVRAKLVKEPLK